MMQCWHKLFHPCHVKPDNHAVKSHSSFELSHGFSIKGIIFRNEWNLLKWRNINFNFKLWIPYSEFFCCSKLTSSCFLAYCISFSQICWSKLSLSFSSCSMAFCSSLFSCFILSTSAALSSWLFKVCCKETIDQDNKLRQSLSLILLLPAGFSKESDVNLMLTFGLSQFPQCKMTSKKYFSLGC